MTDKTYYTESPSATLRAWILSQMLRGAGWAALVLVGAMAIIGGLRLVSWLLPADPYASLDAVGQGARILSALV